MVMLIVAVFGKQDSTGGAFTRKRYYSKFKVGSKEGNGYLVEDLDIPSDRVHKAVKWLASDFLRFANKEIPDGGQRISRDLIRKLEVRAPGFYN